MNKTIKIQVLLAALSALTCAFAGVASATDAHVHGGVALQAAQIPAQVVADLQREVALAHVSVPAMFDVVANVKGCTAAGTLRNRANRPECTRELRALGAPALIPMLQALALESAGRAYATETEKLAYARGLIEATMVLRDPRARGVMTAIFTHATDGGLQILSAEALGRLGSDADVKLLSQHLDANDSLRIAAIKGLAWAVRVDSTQILADLLLSNARLAAPSLQQTEIIAQALGASSSSWGWQARVSSARHVSVARAEEVAAVGKQVQTIAMKALVAAYAISPVKARAHLERALMLAEHPETVATLQALRGSVNAETQAALDKFAAHFAKFANTVR